MRYILTVHVPELRIWDAYWYGYGTILNIESVPYDGIVYTVDYGTDKYRAEGQRDRFHSGLYNASVEVELVCQIVEKHLIVTPGCRCKTGRVWE